MSEAWESWLGHVISGAFGLRRYLGGSDHSGVFLAEFGQGGPSVVAIKLVPVTPALAESQLSDWRAAARLADPHLIRILDAGRCDLDGQPCLYAAMEYAEQSLADLLRNRPLTEDEAREMLLPTLSALAYLHGRNLVQGQLKPSNLLAVGDQLKVASDTIRRIGDGDGRTTVSVYDPPEARDGIYTTAGDIWGLGVTLFESLTRAPPPGLDNGRGGVVLPHDFPPAFRELVAGCLSRRPFDRPKVTEIEAWFRRRGTDGAPATAGQPAAIAATLTREVMPPAVASAPAPEPPIRATTPAKPVAVWPAEPESAVPESAKRRSPGTLILGAVVALVVLALAWMGMRALRAPRSPTVPAVQALHEALPPAPGAAAPAPASSSAPARSQPAVAAPAFPEALHEETPDVPSRAQRTIRGHIRVSVRVIVDQDGKVAAALVDQAGPSRYFARLALEAARKWTFPPAGTQSRRVAVVRFVFARDGIKAHAVAAR